MWYELGIADIIFICAGSQTGAIGRMILDSPESGEAQKHFPFMGAAFGELLYRRKKQKKLYGIMHSGEVILTGKKLESQIGLFQVTDNRLERVNETVLKSSVRILNFWADKWDRIVLEFPTCSSQDEGKDKAVLKILSGLKDNIYVYKDE